MIDFIFGDAGELMEAIENKFHCGGDFVFIAIADFHALHGQFTQTGDAVEFAGVCFQRHIIRDIDMISGFEPCDNSGIFTVGGSLAALTATMLSGGLSGGLAELRFWLLALQRVGKILFENLYQTEDQKPSLIRPLYLVLGRVALALNMDSMTVFQLSRLVLSFVFAYLLYKFTGLFFEDQKTRVYAYVIALTSAGFGFLLKAVYVNVTDVSIPEAFTFLSLSEAPHFILSQILIVGFVWLYIKGLVGKNMRSLVLAGLLMFWLSLEHPFDVFIVIGTVFLVTAYILWKGKQKKK